MGKAIIMLPSAPSFRRGSRVVACLMTFVTGRQYVSLCISGINKCVFCAHRLFFCSGRGSFLVLSAPGRAGSPPKHHGASVGPDRGPWHVLWEFKVASSNGEAFRARRAIQVHANRRTGLKTKCPTAHTISIIGS